jgi:hypothetical protein
VRDRDSKFVAGFEEVFRAEGVEVILTPFRSPQANAHAERFVRTARTECLDWLLILGPRQLDRVLRVYTDQCNTSAHIERSGANRRSRPGRRHRDRRRRRSSDATSSAASSTSTTLPQHDETEYWHPSGGRVGRTLKVARAMLTGMLLAGVPGAPSARARGAAVCAADAGAPAGGAAARRELCASGGGDLPVAGRARAGQHDASSVQQPQRLGDQIAAAMPRAAAYGGDLAGADGLSLMRVLGISQRAQHSPMLTGHASKASGPFGRGAASQRSCLHPADAAPPSAPQADRSKMPALARAPST